MKLDFEYTCPRIDEAIEQMKQEVYDHLYDIIVDQHPCLSSVSSHEMPKEVVGYIKEHANSMSDTLTELFENLRSLNEDMRDAADSQIEELQSIISDLEEERDDLQERLDNE